MCQTIKIPRTPITIPITFHSCNLCYNRKCCCEDAIRRRRIIIYRGFKSWSDTIRRLQSLEENNTLVRLITETPLPDEVVWTAAYAAKNIVQINFDILYWKESITWVTALVHQLERCGVLCVLMIYPILPRQVKTYQVLQLIDAVGSCTGCRIKIRFAEFKNPGLLIHSGFVQINGTSTPLSLVRQIQDDLWGCTDEFKQEFMEYLQYYAKTNKYNVSICEVT